MCKYGKGGKKHFAELIKITRNGYSMIYKQTEINKMVCKKNIQLKKIFINDKIQKSLYISDFLEKMMKKLRKSCGKDHEA